jgi:hypothetical protein
LGLNPKPSYGLRPASKSRTPRTRN